MQSFGLQSPGAAAVSAGSGGRSGFEVACGMHVFRRGILIFPVEI
jgi:hypothetical protein